MARVQRFYLSDEGEPKMEDLLRLSLQQVIVMSDYVDRHGFAGTQEELLALAERLGVSYEKAVDLIQYSGYLQSERARLSLDVNGLLEEFDVYLERHKNRLQTELPAKLKALYEPLRKLFADRRQIALREKVASVTAGVIPEGVDFRSICDLRPIFNDERDKILDFATVALVRVLLRSETHQESTVFFQIDSEGVHKMKDFLERLQKKMAKLETVRLGLREGEK